MIPIISSPQWGQINYENIIHHSTTYGAVLLKNWCNNVDELENEEERVRLELNATLNGKRCRNALTKKERYAEWYNNNKEHRKEYNKEYGKIYRKENREKLLKDKREYGSEIVTCECGCKIRRDSLIKHRKSKKHLKLMERL